VAWAVRVPDAFGIAEIWDGAVSVSPARQRERVPEAMKPASIPTPAKHFVIAIS